MDAVLINLLFDHVWICVATDAVLINLLLDHVWLRVAPDADSKELNANFVRGAHYPQDQRFLDLLDEVPTILPG